MALTAANLARYERLTGTMPAADETSVEERLSRLGSIEAAALEVLLVRRAEMLATPTIMRSADDAINHTTNLSFLDAQIADVAAVLRNTLTTVPTIGVVFDLLVAADGAGAKYSGVLDVPFANQRHG